MAGQEKWYFTREQLMSSPSRKCGLDADKELAYRQQAANLIQDMGQRLQVSQLCINTAIVYMHRFYAFHSFTQFHRNTIAAAALFLAAKVEEQPRKLEYVIKVSHVCLHRGDTVTALDPRSEHYQEQAQDLVFNENVLLQTLGFDVAIDHPHTHVVRTCHLVKAPKDLAQTSYFMASNSLHLTTMCLQYRPTVVACFCIHLASKWSNWAIPQSNEGRHWFSYVDRSVTSELLERLTAEFLHIFDKCPSRLKRKMMTMSSASGSSPQSGLAPHVGATGVLSQANAHTQDKKHSAHARSDAAAAAAAAAAVDDFEKSFDREYEREKRRPQVPGGYVPATNVAPPASTAPPVPTPTPPQKIDFTAYRDKREREERDRRQLQQRQPAPTPRPTPPPAAVTTAAPPHHQRPQQHHHKPHHSWPHHKPPHHKPPHDHRHHRPQQTASVQPPSSATSTHVSTQQELAPVQRTRPPSLFSPENATTPTAAAASAPRRPQALPPQQRRVPQSQSQQSTSQPTHPHPQHATAHNEPPTAHRPPASPPHQRKRPPETATAVIRDMQPPAILSPFSSPPVKEHPPSQHRAHRTRPSASVPHEPELVPVVKKLDETPGYEHVVRDSQRAAAAAAARAARRPESTMPAPPQPSHSAPRALNGIETDPTLVSNLLKESLAKPAPITVPTERRSPAPPSYTAAATASTPVPAASALPVREIKREHPPERQPAAIAPPPASAPPPSEPAPVANAPHPSAPTDEVIEPKHKKEKKKKEKHKHKDRDKSKEERKEERKKHKKDKERDRKQEAAPVPQPPPRPPAETPSVASDAGALRITIPRDKFSASPGLKIKIPKERLAAPPPPSQHQLAPPHHQPPVASVAPPPHQHAQRSGIKIKIPKDVLETSRKRSGAPEAGPPHKMARHNGAPPPHPPHKVEPHAPPLRNGHAM